MEFNAADQKVPLVDHLDKSQPSMHLLAIGIVVSFRLRAAEELPVEFVRNRQAWMEDGRACPSYLSCRPAN